jgi:dTMP kinase
MRGLFISLDGLDGSGKSTHCRLLVEWLRAQGHLVTPCSDPGGTELGDILRGLVLDHRRAMTPACEAFLFMASRSQLVAEVIGPSLDAGGIVVCDRFLLANVVYQGYGGGLDPEQLYAVGRLATGGVEPDLTFVLDLNIEEAARRRQGPADRIESRGADFHARVRAGFRTEAQKYPEKIRLIDATQPLDSVQQEIRREVEGALFTFRARLHQHEGET